MERIAGVQKFQERIGDVRNDRVAKRKEGGRRCKWTQEKIEGR
jgi:hypothetical protein